MNEAKTNVKSGHPGTAADKSGAPIVIDLGKQRRKRVRQLRKGRGRLMDEVNQVIADLKQSGSISEATQPVIVIARQRKRSRYPKWLSW